MASPLLSNVYLWAERWRRREATGDMIIVRYADDIIVGFQHKSDARRFWDAMRSRLAEFSLSLHPDKTRLIEFGRFAAAQRARRGLGKPGTFKFLGFTFICGQSRQQGTTDQLPNRSTSLVAYRECLAIRHLNNTWSARGYRTSFAPETIAINCDEHDPTGRKQRKINGTDLCAAAHNGLVGGSSPPGPTKVCLSREVKTTGFFAVAVCLRQWSTEA